MLTTAKRVKMFPNPECNYDVPTDWATGDYLYCHYHPPASHHTVHLVPVHAGRVQLHISLGSCLWGLIASVYSPPH